VMERQGGAFAREPSPKPGRCSGDEKRGKKVGGGTRQRGGRLSVD